MTEVSATESVRESPAILDRAAFSRLMEALQGRGFEVIGPRVRDGAIVYDTLISAEDLPQGWTDEQSGGIIG
jgi:hypothetical protein